MTKHQVIEIVYFSESALKLCSLQNQLCVKTQHVYDLADELGMQIAIRSVNIQIANCQGKR